jgi:hypothetical protein
MPKNIGRCHLSIQSTQLQQRASDPQGASNRWVLKSHLRPPWLRLLLWPRLLPHLQPPQRSPKLPEKMLHLAAAIETLGLQAHVSVCQPEEISP